MHRYEDSITFSLTQQSLVVFDPSGVEQFPLMQRIRTLTCTLLRSNQLFSIASVLLRDKYSLCVMRAWIGRRRGGVQTLRTTPNRVTSVWNTRDQYGKSPKDFLSIKLSFWRTVNTMKRQNSKLDRKFTLFRKVKRCT